MWILIIVFIFILSIYLSVIIRFDNYRINIFKLIKNDKSGLFLTLGTKMGVGSIIGTIISIIVGGFSSVIWIILFSYLTTSIIYFESYYGYKYKGAPYKILSNGLNNNFLSKLSFISLIILYPFLFQMIQINTISNIVVNSLIINKIYIFLFVICMLISIVFLDTNKVKEAIKIVVIIKCLLFIIIGIIAIVLNINELFLSFNKVVKNLFTIKSIFSGFVIGVKRSIFMNELLIGTTSISASIDKNSIELSTKYQIISVYIVTLTNTLIVTCLMLIYLNNHSITSDYNLLITYIFRYTLGNIGLLLLIIIILLFVFSSLIGGYNVLINHTNNYIIKILFIIICSSSVFLSSNNIWKYTDILIFIMIIINSYSIIKLMRK